MSKAEDIPYQLRPNKFIDRQIFVDLLTKIVPQRDDGRYVYISMGGKHLVDQESVYRRVGIRNLFSFDDSADIVARQLCNRPTAKAVCKEMMASALASEIDDILSTFPKATNIVAWLDYTKRNRLSQLQEFAEVLKKCQAGDVIRITMNADDRTLNQSWEKSTASGPSEFRAEMLKENIAEFFDTKIEAIGKDGLPATLSEAVRIAASGAEEEIDSELTLAPVLLTSYADGMRMFTATLLCHNRKTGLPNGLRGWEFNPKRWSDIVDISAPDLSLREKVEIDKHLKKGPSAILKAIKFKPSSELDDAKIAIESYKRLHRYYPSFYAIGIQ